MKTFIAFVKKEILEEIRTGKLLILGILFVVFGIMNTAVAKLTPWLLEIMADSLAESGMNIAISEVSAIDSWVQFFKNIPMALIVFVLIYGNSFTKEYESGTLILLITKGLKRDKILLAKTAVFLSFWSIGYWLCFYITYFYNDYYWNNDIAKGLYTAACNWWLFGVFVLCLTVLFSVICKNYTAVLLFTGGSILLSYLLGLLPQISYFVPSALMNSATLLIGAEDMADYLKAVLITASLSISCILASIPFFNKKYF